MNLIEFTPAEIHQYVTQRGLNLRKQGRELRGPCPIHHGKRLSFAVNPVTGLWHCHSECQRGGSLIDLEMELGGKDFHQAQAEIFHLVGRAKPNGLGTKLERLLATYDYTDEQGQLLFQCVRYFPKNFKQRRPDGKDRNGDDHWLWNLTDVRRVLYRLPRLKDAQQVLTVEGEKDVHALEHLGFIATCNPMGAGKWKDEYADALVGKDVVIFPDNDEQGRKHAEQIRASLTGKAQSVKLVPVAMGKDVSEWIAAGATRETIDEAIRTALYEPWSPKKSPSNDTRSSRLSRTTKPAESPQGSELTPSASSLEPLPKTITVAPEPQFDEKTGRLSGPIPTIGDTLLHRERFASNEGEKLHIFRDGVYRDHGLDFIRQSGQELMRQWGVEKQWRKGLADEIHEWVLLPSPELWECPPMNRINLRNGIFNLETEELEAHSPSWLSPIQLPILYDPKADCPAWDEFCEAVLPGDCYREQVTYQLIALLMIPYTAAQKSLLCQGPRSTGKSRWLSAIRSFLGASNTCSKSLHALEENRFAVPYLYGKLANICPDLPSRHLESTSVFKAITGEDYVDGEYKFGAQFQFKPFCRLLFSANLPPQSDDATDAFFDRWWVILFEHCFQGSKEQISSEKLDRRLAEPRELSGVLNRALKLLPMVREQMGITETASMLKAHDEFCAVTDPFRGWLSEYIIDDPQDLAPAPCDPTYKSYCEFRRNRTLPPISKTAFGIELRKHKHGIESKQCTVNTKLTWCYPGISLKKKENEPQS